MIHEESHRSHRVGWLRAAVLGANDGIVSTASLIIGIAAAGTTHEQILLAGIAGLVAGAMSMAAGEYVSVSSQADTERADLEMERLSLENHEGDELVELAAIYEDRGLDSELAMQVAVQLHEHDALAVHARDEIGISEIAPAKPVQASIYSAATFTIGAALPLVAATIVSTQDVIVAVALSSLVFLMVLGAVAARTGGAPMVKGAVRVLFWGALAMVLTAAVGHVFGVVA